MIRNNLSKNKKKIPFIEINPFSSWNKTMEISFEEGFSITDLFLSIRSYSDSLIIVPIQMMVLVEDEIEKGRSFFTESVSIHRLSDMSLIDFSVWYSLRLDKDYKYLGHEFFKHKIIFKFVSMEYEEMYPIYPWNSNVLSEMLSSTITERGEKVKFLMKRIEELESMLKNKKDGV